MKNIALFLSLLCIVFSLLVSCSDASASDFNIKYITSDFTLIDDKNFEAFELSSDKIILLNLSRDNKKAFLKEHYDLEMDNESDHIETFTIIRSYKNHLSVDDFYIHALNDQVLEVLNLIISDMLYASYESGSYIHQVHIVDSNENANIMNFASLVMSENNRDGGIDTLIHTKYTSVHEEETIEVTHMSDIGSLLKTVGTPANSGNDEYYLTTLGHETTYKVDKLITFDGSYIYKADTRLNSWTFDLDHLYENQYIEVISVFSAPKEKKNKSIVCNFTVDSHDFKYRYYKR